MLTDTGAVKAYFAKLGFESEIADIYLALHTYGAQTISELSRNSKVERTRIYRLIDRLMESNLIELETRYKRGAIKAAPIANLNILISQKEQELRSLQDELGLIQEVMARNSLSTPSTRVQFYYGLEGYKQVLWNQANSKTEVMRVMHESIPPPDAGKDFSDKWTAQCKANGVQFRDAHNSTQKQSWDVYEDTVVYYSRKDNDIFTMTIQNIDIADSQRQFFDMLWAQSKTGNQVMK